MKLIGAKKNRDKTKMKNEKTGKAIKTKYKKCGKDKK
jgi:hypothetical protein